MKTAMKTILIVVTVLSTLIIAISIKVWWEDDKARENKILIRKLIGAGQQISEAENILKKTGYRLMYDEPIKPTTNKDYLQQIVIIGETQPNIFETFAYATQSNWVPFTHKESQHMVIDATLNGVITEIR
jgi:hypothetical protein